MDISVVITLYNKEKEISRAVRSVLNQTIRPKEIIVVDDGSSDGGGDVVDRMQVPGMRLIRQENTGSHGARNRGIAEAECDLIALLDGDDTWEPRFVETIMRMCREYPHCGIYGTAWQKQTSSGKITVPEFHRMPPVGKDGILEDYFASAARGEMLCSSAVAIPRKVFDTVGMFPAETGPGGDRETWLRIAVDYPVAFCNEVLATWHLDAGNRFSNCIDYRTKHPVIRTGELILSRQDLPTRIKRGLYMYVTSTRIFLARQLIQSGRRKEARTVLLERGIPSRFVSRWLACLCGTYLPGETFTRIYDVDCVIKRYFRRFSRRQRASPPAQPFAF